MQLTQQVQQTHVVLCQVEEYLPDKDCTPGDIFPEATTEHICTSGYAQSVRSVSQKKKKKVYEMYGILKRSPGQYEIDHLVPLSLGGSNDIKNLWPQEVYIEFGTNEKDTISRQLRKLVCDGKMPLGEAQKSIAANWKEALR